MLLLFLLFFYFNLNDLLAFIKTANKTDPMDLLWLLALRARRKITRLDFPVCAALSAAR